MVFLYSSLISVLVVLRWLVSKISARAFTRWESRQKIAEETGAQVAMLTFPGRNQCPIEDARKNRLLTHAVEAMDRAEARYQKWNGRHDLLSGWLACLRAFKGRKLPYSAGVLDVVGTLAVLDATGLDVKAVVDLVTQWVNG